MKNNIFANGLMVLIGLLMLLSALQLFGWGRGIQSLEPEPFDPNVLAQLEVGDDAALAQIDNKTLDQITDAPLFSMDRKPFEPLENPIDDPGVTNVAEPEPLKARVTSIIITPENSYAMVFDELSNANVTLKQGMPLPGEQGLWLLDTINPRAVTFVADGEEPVELSLEVFDGQLNAAVGNNKNRNRNKAANNRNNDANKDQPKKNSAEEIRRKIAERRAQMRANAAKGKEE
ncbi:hypothetical protein OS175_02010 [Marinicella sp. S1101]|uniref:hypothetical protein n=1 Tax=Marinicella marina TaxID=2996016 RepID=UPI0022610180|nr:hypothetical protein [Marinicella marina]MCX7552639.1 hypothetical protein [Marinicella marina]MDJ1139515.1 hypothetical protein [Marinicella marina]